MADAMISVVVERVAALIEEQIRYEVNLVRGVEKDLLELSNKLETIRDVLEDAEKRGVNDQSVKRWLKKLEATAYEMDDILDEWNYSLLKHKMEASAEPKKEVCCSVIPSSCLCFKKVSVRRETAKKIEHVKFTLDQILKEKDDFSFVTSQPATNRTPTPWREQSTHLIDLKKVHGWDIHRKKNDILSKLMLDDADARILSIVGTGGLGKTTLAKLVYNDNQVVDCFKLRIWICVSNPFDVVGIARGIVDSVGIEKIPPNTNQLALVLQKLEKSVSGKRFLLVLDDVWTEDESKWKDLKISLQCAAGSKILVTTRNERVAKMMGTLDDDMYRPNHLSEEECWSLLRDTSLSNKTEEECRKFEYLGKKIASKCKGLPLAAIVLGRLLRFKDLEGWKHVENSEIWQMEKVEVELFPHLVLSYNELSPTLKHCFSYCAFYPKDHRIHAETFIEQWMALGYMRSVGGNGELEGRECLNNLAMHSLFQDVEVSESGEQIEWCKMHDIVHDFALFLRKNDDKRRSCQICDSAMVSQVQEYRSLYWNDRAPHDVRERFCQVCDCLKSLRVLKVEGFHIPPPVGMKRLIHLRWLEFTRIKMSKDDLKIICRLYFLHTLLLLNCTMTEIPREIENLVQLRRLTLSGNEELKELPDSIYRLVELRSLSLEGCSLEEIPREIGNLVQLRRLDLNGNIELKELPESIYSLVELRSLSLANCSLKEIHGGIGKLVQLRQLDLSGNREIQELPESICGLVELQILKIKDNNINCLPEALGELSNLRTLEPCKLRVGSHFNKLGFLKNISGLLTGSLDLKIYFSSMSEMVELVEDAGEAQSKILLQKLKELKIRFMCKMNEMEQSSSSSMWMEVVEVLVPHLKLNQLTIIRYGGSRLPRWMSSPLNFIKEIQLFVLSEVSSLPAMGKLPLLESIYILNVEQLKLVGHEFLGIESSSDNNVVAFPKLKQLTIDGCHKWEEWEDITEAEEESAAISIMPYLTKLSIYECESLKKLPHRLLHRASSSLHWLYISGSTELIETYGENKEGSPWRSISQHNPQLRLRIGVEVNELMLMLMLKSTAVDRFCLRNELNLLARLTQHNIPQMQYKVRLMAEKISSLI